MYDLKLKQMDVKTTFLHGKLEEEMQMKQPQKCIEQCMDDLLRTLNKCIQVQARIKTMVKQDSLSS